MPILTNNIKMCDCWLALPSTSKSNKTILLWYHATENVHFHNKRVNIHFTITLTQNLQFIV